MDNAIEGKFAVVQSDCLFEEIGRLFKREFDKDVAGRQRYLMLSLPFSETVSKAEWELFVNSYRGYITDEDDLPHICAYFAGNCDYFVTTNRRLTKMKVKEKVNFMSPKKFVERVLGLKGLDTIDEI